eukprot:m.50340 g.50340  ORF g.50340 m.50340 type:complete len:422 (+) comp34066_c0_seq4:44-1309(+)
MRLCCEVSIVYSQLVSQTAAKPVRATVGVGRKTGPKSKLVNGKTAEMFLTISTAKDITGRKYQVTGNVKQMFTKFWSQGKATVQFKDPAHHLCISKAEPGELRTFLGILKMNPSDQKDAFQALPLIDDVCQHMDQPKVRMTVSKRKNYPLRDGFPGSLETLNIHDCGLARVDTRILELRNLKTLDLSHNKIKALPPSMSHLSGLASFNLACNDLAEFPGCLCDSPFSASLKCLDLTDNQLVKLPYHFGKLSGLVVLKLDRNKLQALSPTFCKLRGLRQFSAASNCLPCLPPNTQSLQLDSTDLSGNPFMEESCLRIIQNCLGVPTMKEICARAVTSAGLAYGPRMLPRQLCQYLDLMKTCVCGASCADTLLHFVAPLDLGRISRTVVSSSKRHVPVEGYFCSTRCYNRGQTRGQLTWYCSW